MLRLLGWLSLAAFLALSGCKHRGGCATPPADAVDCRAVARTRIDPDVRVLPPPLETKPDDRAYCGMTPHETQCRAAEKSGTAEMMRGEYESLEAQHCFNRNSKNTRMKQTMLRHASVEARDVAAGTALELYYRLAELEAKADLLRDGLALSQSTLEELRRVKDQGFKVPAELEKVLKQQQELQADLVRAQLGIQQLNGELARLLHWHDLGLRVYLWPVASFTVTETADEPESAVALGMAHRAQLSMLRAVRNDMDAKTMPTLLLLLRSYNGFLGMTRTESFVSFLSGIAIGKNKEVDKRRQQMDALLKEQEFVVSQEIRQAIHTIQAKTKLVGLAREKTQQAQDKLKDLEDKKERGVASTVEVSAQKLNVMQAQAEVIQEVMAWHIARAKLKQAQGLLSMECGYTPDNPWHPGRGCIRSSHQATAACPAAVGPVATPGPAAIGPATVITEPPLELLRPPVMPPVKSQPPPEVK